MAPAVIVRLKTGRRVADGDGVADVARPRHRARRRYLPARRRGWKQSEVGQALRRVCWIVLLVTTSPALRVAGAPRSLDEARFVGESLTVDADGDLARFCRWRLIGLARSGRDPAAAGHQTVAVGSAPSPRLARPRKRVASMRACVWPNLSPTLGQRRTRRTPGPRPPASRARDSAGWGCVRLRTTPCTASSFCTGRIAIRTQPQNASRHG